MSSKLVSKAVLVAAVLATIAFTPLSASAASSGGPGDKSTSQQSTDGATRPDGTRWTADPGAPRQAAMALQTWGACGAFDKSTKVIRTFSRKYTSGTSPYMGSGSSNLACGSDAWGYRHIVNNHLSQWQARAAEANENWRTTADFSIEEALKDPDVTRYRASNDTYCFSRLVYLVDDRTHEVVDHMYPNVIVARVTKNIITAYPASRQCS